MIPYEQHLLPTNASNIQQVISSIAVRVNMIPAPIDTVKRGDTAPAGFLTFLAWEYSIDLWKNYWPEINKRVVVSSWFKDHMIKGTRRALERYCGYVGSEIVSVVKPPGKTYLSDSWTKEDRERWLRTLPSVKLWDQRQRGRAYKRFFAGASEGPDRYKAFFEGHWVYPSDAAFRMERRGEMEIDGVVTPVDVDGLGNQVDRIRIRGKNSRGFFCDVARVGFLIPSTASDRVIVFTFKDAPPHGIRFPVRPGLEVKSVIPELVYERSVARPSSLFFGQPLHRKYLPPSGAPDRIYSRVAIFDRSLVLPARKALAYCGLMRLGMPAHTAEIKVSIPGKRSRKAFRFVGGFLIEADREKYNDTFTAIRAAKRLSDRLLINTKTYRPMKIGTPLLIGGKFQIGRWTRS